MPVPPPAVRTIPFVSEPTDVFCWRTFVADEPVKVMLPPMEMPPPMATEPAIPNPPPNVTEADEGEVASKVEEQENATTLRDPGNEMTPDALFTTSGTMVFKRMLDIIS